MSYITVCTPTYNRSHTLHIPFNSLCKQSFKDFEWLVIDDGSIDDTEQVIEQFKRIADFPIMYIKTENHGKAAALNTSYNYVKSKYYMILDSDDEYLDDTLEKVYNAWNRIPKDEYDRFWCVTGHCVDSDTGEIIGGKWPENINRLSGRRQHKLIVKHKKGEKTSCRKIEILKKHPFPQYPETKFVSEGVVWGKIDKEYDQYCINDVLRIYHSNVPGSLSKGKDIKTKYTYYYLNLFCLNECFSQLTYNKSVRLSILNISRLAIIVKRPYKQVMKEINKWYKRILVTLGYPFMWIFNKVYYK